ncbi:MAG: hypothetical protein IKU44_01720 [Firmicutes bacterium]|nr:hypothetical protein [Bacillota bacterium]
MNKSPFQVLRGGLLDTAETSPKEFVSAYVTNTRLMGVVGMYIHFALPQNEYLKDLHQFFYFDAEEYSFETYRSVLGNDKVQIQEIEGSMFGGLGADKISITLEEAKHVLHEYVLLNRQRRLPMPKGMEEYKFLLTSAPLLSEPEEYMLDAKLCVKPASPYEVVNYFLMRCFGKDFRGASYLASPDLKMELFPDFKGGTFLKNDIEFNEDDHTYTSESLVEFGNNYYIAVTTIVVQHMKVVSYERNSAFKISHQEAALMLGRAELITVYDIVDDFSEFGRGATELTANAQITKYDSGTLYMMYNPNNNHVNKKNYRLNEDVLGTYFISDGGQLICAAYGIDQVLQLEWDLVRSPYRKKLEPVEKYQFKEPVLYEFIQSGIDDFVMFVEMITFDE